MIPGPIPEMAGFTDSGFSYRGLFRRATATALNVAGAAPETGAVHFPVSLLSGRKIWVRR